MSPTDLLCRHIYPELITISESDQKIPFLYSTDCVLKKKKTLVIFCV